MAPRPVAATGESRPDPRMTNVMGDAGAALLLVRCALPPMRSGALHPRNGSVRFRLAATPVRDARGARRTPHVHRCGVPFYVLDPFGVAVLAAGGALAAGRKRMDLLGLVVIAIADAFGLAIFTIAGAHVAERAGVSALIVVPMATTTGVAGGVLRGVRAAVIPVVLRRGDAHATASVAEAATYLLLTALASRSVLAVAAGSDRTA